MAHPRGSHGLIIIVGTSGLGRHEGHQGHRSWEGEEEGHGVRESKRRKGKMSS